MKGDIADLSKRMLKTIEGVGKLEVGNNKEVITNPFSGVSCELEPEAVAVYDFIKGAEMFGMYDAVIRGLDYFRKHWPKEYMDLLD